MDEEESLRALAVEEAHILRAIVLLFILALFFLFFLCFAMLSAMSNQQ